MRVMSVVLLLRTSLLARFEVDFERYLQVHEGCAYESKISLSWSMVNGCSQGKCEDWGKSPVSKALMT
jgi:hypothetical protein